MQALLYSTRDYVNEKNGYTLRMNYIDNKDFVLHYHEYYEFFITVEGKVVHLVNGERQYLAEHSLVLIRPKDSHDYLHDQPYSWVNIAFLPEIMESMVEFFGSPLVELIEAPMPPTILLDDADFRRLMGKINSLNTLDPKDTEENRLRIKLVLTELFSELVSCPTDIVGSDVPLWLSSLAERLTRPESFSMTLRDMSAEVGRTVEHISRSFSRYFGLTASEFMNENKLTYAANLLLNTNLSAVDVCYESGFQNVSWFYRLFKARFGASPREFRRNRGASSL